MKAFLISKTQILGAINKKILFQKIKSNLWNKTPPKKKSQWKTVRYVKQSIQNILRVPKIIKRHKMQNWEKEMKI